jgi:hypothetical protein
VPKSSSIAQLAASWAIELRATVAAYRDQYLVSAEVERRKAEIGITEASHIRGLTDQERASVSAIWKEAGYDAAERRSEAAHRRVECIEAQLAFLAGGTSLSAFFRLCALWRNGDELRDGHDQEFLRGALTDLAAALGLPDPTIFPKRRNIELKWRERWNRLAEVADAIAVAAKAAIH